MMKLDVKLATPQHLEDLLPLFQAYQAFHGISLEPAKVIQFLQTRLEAEHTVILMAYQNLQTAGFLVAHQLYSSIALKPQWLLNDLFVSNELRRQGVATSLVKTLEQIARQDQFFSIKLATRIDNNEAHALYSSLGYQKLAGFSYFSKRLIAPAVI